MFFFFFIPHKEYIYVQSVINISANQKDDAFDIEFVEIALGKVT